MLFLNNDNLKLDVEV